MIRPGSSVWMFGEMERSSDVLEEEALVFRSADHGEILGLLGSRSP